MQMFFDGHYPAPPREWFSASEEPRHIPDISAVYIAVGKDKLVKYVGQTTSMKRRFAEHKSWLKATDRVGWIPCQDSELVFLESWFIATLRPYLNANQNKSASKALAMSSALLETRVSSVWKVGRTVACNQSKCNFGSGIICGLSKDRFMLNNGFWYPKSTGTVCL